MFTILVVLMLVTQAAILWRINSMAGELDALTAQVEANNTLVGSAITLLQGLKKALDDAGTDPVKLKALSDSLGAKDQELADAIAANTPEDDPLDSAALRSG